MVDLGSCSSDDTKNRFVCPNDRQLSLRAKLRTGWSVKTATVGSYKANHQPAIDQEEQEAIIKVIKRAEQVDQMEQERVGRLMERLENMRRNALGKNTNQCILCGDTFGILGAHKLRCNDCKQLVCNKCSIGNTKSNPFCMICAETREIWKKSGAWFFRSLPKYILPESQRNFGATSKRTGSFRRFPKDDDSSSDEERKNFKIPYKPVESSHDLDSLAVSEPFPQYSRQNSSSESSQISKDLDKTYMSCLTLGELKYPYDEEFIEEVESSKSPRRGSSTSADEKVNSPSSPSINSISLLDTSNGLIDLSMTYDTLTSTLHVTVYRAKNISPMDINGLADPFCKLNILPDAKVSTRLRTKTVYKTRNPEFNENLTFYEISEKDLSFKSLHVLCLDDDKYGHDYMGEIKISLVKLKVQNTIYLTLPLEKMAQDPRDFDDLWLRGQILLSLCYSTKKRALLVTVVKCSNLLPMDNNGFSDPFVKLHLRPDPYHRKHKTSIKWKNLNPVYNEEFTFESRPNELATQSLHIAVWDKDYGKSNDYLGGLIVGGLGSKGRRLKHWLDMIRYPDHRHDHWHNLTDDQIND